MSAVGAETGQGQVHAAVEGQLGLNNAEGLGALFIALALVAALYYFINNVI